jgi:hypothetical protein
MAWECLMQQITMRVTFVGEKYAIFVLSIMMEGDAWNVFIVGDASLHFSLLNIPTTFCIG